MKRLDDGEGRTLACDSCCDDAAHYWAVRILEDGDVVRWASGAVREHPICEHCANCGPDTGGVYVAAMYGQDGALLLDAWTSDYDRMARVYHDAAETFYHAKDVVRAFPAAKALDVMRPPLASDDLAKAVWAMSWGHQQWHDDLRMERAREDAERYDTPESQGWGK